jgi:hypothetical protein
MNETENITRDVVEYHFKQIEKTLMTRDSFNGWHNNITWMGITLEWKSTPLYKGGNLKRGNVYGKIYYSYLNDYLDRETAILEVLKPKALRQALIEASTSIECSMCGKVVVGKDAIDPYRDIDFSNGRCTEKKAWGLIYYGMQDYGIKQEPRYLNFCPDCLSSIANGDYKE